MAKPQPPVRDRRGLTTVEYAMLFVMLCVGVLAVWSALGRSLGCNLALAHAKFVRALGGEAEAFPPECAHNAGGSSSGLSVLTGRQGRPGSSSGQAPSAPSSTPSAATKPSKPVPPPPSAADELTRELLQIMCPQDKTFLRDLKNRGVQIKAYQSMYYDDPYYDGKRWTTKRTPLAGETTGSRIDMIVSNDPVENAATVFHEGVHTGQRAGLSKRDTEFEAYSKEEAWRISHGLPALDPRMRSVDATGRTVVNPAGVRNYVDKLTGVAVAPPSGSGPPEEIIKALPNGQVQVRQPNGTVYTRPPKAGDSYYGQTRHTQPPGGIVLDMNKLQCP